MNSEAFYERTIRADLDATYDKFLAHIRVPSKILDAGCGVGRDSKLFISKDHTVQAFDGSEEMVRIASKELDQTVLHMTFQDMSFEKEFDAIWAYASLLHVPYEELCGVVERLSHALKPNGILYASFKYGDCLRKVDGRDFFDHNEQTIKPYLEGLFDPIDIWVTEDTRSRATNFRKSWLNILSKVV